MALEGHVWLWRAMYIHYILHFFFFFFYTSYIDIAVDRHV